MWYILSELKKQVGVPADFTKKPITEQEYKVLETLRKLEYGEVRVVVQATEIVQIVEQKSIKVK